MYGLADTSTLPAPPATAVAMSPAQAAQNQLTGNIVYVLGTPGRVACGVIPGCSSAGFGALPIVAGVSLVFWFGLGWFLFKR